MCHTPSALSPTPPAAQIIFSLRPPPIVPPPAHILLTAHPPPSQARGERARRAEDRTRAILVLAQRFMLDENLLASARVLERESGVSLAACSARVTCVLKRNQKLRSPSLNALQHTSSLRQVVARAVDHARAARGGVDVDDDWWRI